MLLFLCMYALAHVYHMVKVVVTGGDSVECNVKGLAYNPVMSLI